MKEEGVVEGKIAYKQISLLMMKFQIAFNYLLGSKDEEEEEIFFIIYLLHAMANFNGWIPNSQTKSLNDDVHEFF